VPTSNGREWRKDRKGGESTGRYGEKDRKIGEGRVGKRTSECFPTTQLDSIAILCEPVTKVKVSRMCSSWLNDEMS